MIIAQPLIESRFLLADIWDHQENLSDWWISEKYDGIRTWWDGCRFYSRQGNEFPAPDWFTRDLPTTELDGELWLGRGRFQQTNPIVHSANDPGWRQIRFVVFDAPGIAGEFESRYGWLSDLFAAVEPRNARLALQTRCRDNAELIEKLARVESQGGEGLMARQPGSIYECGYSSHTLLKIKSSLDAEGVVIGYKSGTGRNRDRIGSLRMRLDNGIMFSLGGLSDVDRNDPPPIGSVVTFRYQGVTDRGVPRNAFFVRRREELENFA